MDQPGKVANPARGQLKRENYISLSPCVPDNLVSRDGFSRPVPRQPAHLHYIIYIHTCQSAQAVDTANVGGAFLRSAVTEHDAIRRPFTVQIPSSEPDRVTMLPFMSLIPTDVIMALCPGSSRTNDLRLLQRRSKKKKTKKHEMLLIESSQGKDARSLRNSFHT